jgi:hypothetical protein
MELFSVVLGYNCSTLFVEWSFDYIQQFNIRPTHITPECILNYVKLKMYKEATFLINEGEDFDAGDLREHLVKLKHPVEKFIRKSELLAKEVTLVPAFKWAQSKDTVFLEVRLAIALTLLHITRFSSIISTLKGSLSVLLATVRARGSR